MIALTTPNPIQLAAGQFTELSCRVQSSTSLIGRPISANVAAWLDSPDAETIGVEPNSNIFRGFYPLSGTVEMSWIGSPLLQNWKCYIDVINATTFDIRLKFIPTTDLNRYTSQLPSITNDARFKVESILGSSVYDIDKWLVISVWESTFPPSVVELVAARCEFEFNDCLYFNDSFPVQFNLFVNDLPATGFYAGEDLKVEVTVIGSADNIQIGGVFYAGIIKEEPDNAGNLVNSHDFGYAKIAALAAAVDAEINNPFTAGMGFTQQNLGGGLIGLPNTYEGTFTVGGDYFEDGCYRVYVVFQDSTGIWHSAKSDIICNLGAPNTPTYGTIVPTIEHNEVEYTDKACVSEVAPCETLKLCAAMDEDSYNTAAQTNEVPGTYQSNLEVINVYVSDQPPASGQSLNEIPGLTFLQTSADGCYEFMVPESWSGQTKYIVFEYVFNIDGEYRDYIYFAHTVSVIDIESGHITVVSVHDLNNEEFENGRICLEYTDVIKINIEHDTLGTDTIEIIDLSGIVLSAPDAFVTGEAQIIVDAKKLSLGLEKCFKIISTPFEVTETDCECFNIDVTLTVESTSGGIANLLFEYALLSPPAGVQQVIITQGTGTPLFFDTPEGEAMYQITGAGQVITLPVVILVILENGCTYTTAPALQVFNLEGNTRSVEYDICIADPPFGGLTCPDNNPTIQYTCDFIDSESVAYVTWNATDIDSPIASETKEYTTDGGQTWLPYVSGAVPAPSSVRWTIEFSDDCPTIVWIQPILCFRAPLECNNQPEIECIFDPETDMFSVETAINPGGSEISDWNIEYSTDGGIIFSAYVEPFEVDPGIDQIIVIAIPDYVDGCPSDTLTCTWNRDDAPTNCDYSEYELTSEFDPGTGAHIPTFTGDESLLEVNVKEYSLDGGLTWTTYGANPTGELVLFRWTISFGGGCCDKILISGSRSSTTGQMMRIRMEPIALDALGAPTATFTLDIPAGYELINEDHIIVIQNNVTWQPGTEAYQWSVNLATAEVTHANAFDPADFSEGDELIYEYWVRSI